MARLPRFVLPGQPQHVIQRGNNREPIFCEETDYHFYLEKLEAGCQKHGCDLHAYVLMTNHVHLLITPHTTDGIGKLMQMLGRYYVQYFNYQYERTGTLWEGRYRATLLDSEQYLLACMRYIELNPVRAAMVEHPRDYPWSSYHRNALGRAGERIVAHSVYRRLGGTAEERQAAYRALFRQHVAAHTLEENREVTNKAWILGNERLRSRIESHLNRRSSPRARGGDRKSKEYVKAKINRV